MSKFVKVLRKIGIALVGFPLLVIGIILIPLPGPGVLVCLLALLILSTEFEWTKKYLDRAKAELKKVFDKAQARADKIDKPKDK